MENFKNKTVADPVQKTQKQTVKECCSELLLFLFQTFSPFRILCFLNFCWLCLSIQRLENIKEGIQASYSLALSFSFLFPSEKFQWSGTLPICIKMTKLLQTRKDLPLDRFTILYVNPAKSFLLVFCNPTHNSFAAFDDHGSQ